jgi:putative transposase
MGPHLIGELMARADVFDYIEVFCNRQRRHSHLGGVSPAAFEQASY